MNEMLILVGILVVGWVGLLLLRVPSSIAFLSLLIGQLVSTEASEDVYSFISLTLHVSDVRYVQAVLLMLPLILTIVFLRGRVQKPKLPIEAVPNLFVVALTMLLLTPLFSTLNNALQMATNDRLEAYKSIIVIAASVSGLLSAWLSYPKSHGKAHEK